MVKEYKYIAVKGDFITLTSAFYSTKSYQVKNETIEEILQASMGPTNVSPLHVTHNWNSDRPLMIRFEARLGDGRAARVAKIAQSKLSKKGNFKISKIKKMIKRLLAWYGERKNELDQEYQNRLAMQEKIRNLKQRIQMNPKDDICFDLGDPSIINLSLACKDENEVTLIYNLIRNVLE